MWTFKQNESDISCLLQGLEPGCQIAWEYEGIARLRPRMIPPRMGAPSAASNEKGGLP